MRISKNPTTVMTANGEVQTREEATVNVKQLDLFVTVMLLEETPAVLSLAETTSHQKRQEKLIATSRTMYHLWFLVYQRVLPQRHHHLLLHHLHHRIPYLMSIDTAKIQYQKEVEVRVNSFRETCSINQQKPKTKIKMKELHDFPDWLQEFRGNLVVVVVVVVGENARQVSTRMCQFAE